VASAYYPEEFWQREFHFLEKNPKNSVKIWLF
jgi:hypothetical protein